MWTIIAALLSIAIFAKIVFISQEKAFRHIQEKALADATQRAGWQIANFARAARTYSQINSSTPGTTINVPILASSNLLPNGFPSTTPFGQTLAARVGTSPSRVVAYATGAPDLTPFGMKPSNLQNQQSVMRKTALVAQTSLEGMTGVMVGISAAALLSDSPPYTHLWQPFAASGFTVSTYIPGFSASNPTTLVLFPD